MERLHKYDFKNISISILLLFDLMSFIAQMLVFTQFLNNHFWFAKKMICHCTYFLCKKSEFCYKWYT